MASSAAQLDRRVARALSLDVGGGEMSVEELRGERSWISIGAVFVVFFVLYLFDP
jgi:hypothetical protein